MFWHPEKIMKLFHLNPSCFTMKIFWKVFLLKCGVGWKLFPPLWTLFFNLKAKRRWWKIDTGSLRWKDAGKVFPLPHSSIYENTILLLSICSFICYPSGGKSFNGKIVSFLLRWDSREIYEHFHNWLNLNLSCLQAKVLNTCLCFPFLWCMTFLLIHTVKNQLLPSRLLCAFDDIQQEFLVEDFRDVPQYVVVV